MIAIREAQDADIPQVVRFVGDILRETGAQKSRLFDEAFWRWEYRTPGREALAVLALDGDRIVGAFHLTPRVMLWQGERRMMALLQDLGVHRDYRRRGVFMMMADFAAAAAAQRGWDVTYSLPNERSYPGFIHRQGYTAVAVVPVRVCPLNLGAAARRLPAGLLWQVIARPAGQAARAARAVFAMRGVGTLRRIDRFGSEVDAVGASWVNAAGAGCIRDAAFLNWRFVDKPGALYDAAGWYVDDALRAYVVTRRAPMFGADCLLLMDFAGAPDCLLPLISQCMGAAYQAGAALAVTMGLHPQLGALRRLGFVTVPDRLNPRVLRFIARRHTDQVPDAVTQAAVWALTLADWDVL